MPTVSKYNQNKDYFDFKVEHYRKQGITDKQIANNLGIAYSTFKHWKATYKDFLAAYKKGRVEIIEQIENAMYKRAKGYDYEEVTTEIKKNKDGQVILKHVKKIKKHVAPDPTAAIFLMTNIKNNKWKRNPDIIPEDIEGKTITVNIDED